MSRRRPRVRRQEMQSGELMLAAMVDMLINILIFLLTLYGTGPIQVHPSPDLMIPDSSSERPIVYAPSVRISTGAITVEGRTILALQEGPSGPQLPPDAVTDGMITALQSALQEVIARSPDPGPPEPGASEAEPRRLDIQCDRRIPWEVLGPVVDTAGQAGFPQFRFIVRSLADD